MIFDVPYKQLTLVTAFDHRFVPPQEQTFGEFDDAKADETMVRKLQLFV